MIRNWKDLKTSYLIVHLLEQEEKQGKNVKECLISLKREIRQYQKMKAEQTEVVALDADFDGAILLYELDVPNHWCEDDVREWFEDNERLHAYPSQYDCTGQQFTCWYRLFKRRGKWMTYHRVCLDV